MDNMQTIYEVSKTLGNRQGDTFSELQSNSLENAGNA